MPQIGVLGSGIVYFIHLLDGRTKIGMTSNWKKRRRDHILNGLNIDYEMLLFVTQARSVENFYHEKFKDKKIKNEFFNLDKEDWLDVVDEAMFIYDFFNNLAIKQIVFPLWMNELLLGCSGCGCVFVEGLLGAPELGCLWCGSKLEPVELLAGEEVEKDKVYNLELV